MTILGGISITIALYVCSFIAFSRRHYDMFTAFMVVGTVMVVFVASRIIP